MAFSLPRHCLRPHLTPLARCAGGEDFDARLWQAGWDGGDFDDSGWSTAVEWGGPGCSLAPAIAPPLQVMEVLPGMLSIGLSSCALSSLTLLVLDCFLSCPPHIVAQ